MSRALQLIEKVDKLKTDESFKMKPQDFMEPFERTKKVEDFLKSHRSLKLDKQLEDAGDGLVSLNKKMAKELARSWDIFVVKGGDVDEYIDSIEKDLKDQADKLIKTVSSKVGVNPKDIEVEVSVGEDSSEVTISYQGDELELDGGYFLGNEDWGAVVSDAADSWDWAAWLADWDSPLFQKTFYDAYVENQRYNTASELGPKLSYEGSSPTTALKDFLVSNMTHEE